MILRALALAALLAAPASAQTLRIGMAAETNGADPHNFALTPNSTLRDNIYQGLVDTDAKGLVRPGLATGWTRSDDLTWHFTLRDGVRFSDGSAFGAADVVATFCRTLNNKEEMSGSFSHTVVRLAAVAPEGANGLLIRTMAPEPLLPVDLAQIAILPRSLAPAGLSFDAKTACGGGGPWPSVADFNSGKAAIGTGPYRQAEYSRGGLIVLERNPFHAGPRPPWDKVRLLPITQPTARLAALLAGDQDLVEAPGTADLPMLRSNGKVLLTSSPTWRLLFLQMDVARETTPFIAGPNPLRDVRVRQALSMALNRPAIVGRIMDGTATEASQFLLTGMAGTLPELKALPYDPARARALLAEAGFPQGFAVTIHGTNNRYVNDGGLLQAVAQQWQRVGVKAEVEAMPAVSFFSRRGKREFSVQLGGWQTALPETLGFFRYWLITQDMAQGLGTSNYGGWSDAAFDKDVRAALATMDDAARAGLLRAASARAVAQLPVIPLHFESALWASRAGLRYPGRGDAVTRAADVQKTDVQEMGR
ncbi:MAG: ABC transporter substrate-binding protein [Janthinobacterium lividum]